MAPSGLRACAQVCPLAHTRISNTLVLYCDILWSLLILWHTLTRGPWRGNSAEGRACWHPDGGQTGKGWARHSSRLNACCRLCWLIREEESEGEGWDVAQLVEMIAQQNAEILGFNAQRYINHG